MAKTDLDELIEYYQIEINTLEQLVKEDLEVMDYKAAHLHSKALAMTHRKLRVLNSLNDPYYEKKWSLEDQKKSYQKYTSDNNKFMNNYKEERLREINQKLEELNKKPKPFVEDSQYIDDAIYDLIEGKIRSFKLNLNKRHNFYLWFSLAEGGIMKIDMTPVKHLKSNYFIYQDHINGLKAIGFKLDKEEEKLYYEYQVSQFVNSIELKTLLSSVLLDVFYSQEMDRPAFLELY